MGRAPCCDKTKVKRGPWSPEEDSTLKNYVENYGTGGNWIALPQKAGLKRCGKSCRLRWLNYLRPNIKHGGFTEEEDRMILSLYRNIGSRWSVIASQLPGRTDNDVKNYWNTKLKKKLLATSSPPPTATSSTMPPDSFIPNSFNSFDQPSRLLDTIYVTNDSEFDFPVDTSSMLPYYPMESNQEMFISQFPLPGGIDVVAGNPPYNGGLLLPAADPLHYHEAVSSFSPPFSWSSGEESSLVAELHPYNLLNGVVFHENLDHFTCVGGSTDHFVNIG